MADEVAQALAARFGAPRNASGISLEMMLRRCGGALPRRLRREARRLAEAQTLCESPRIARQLDPAAAGRAHAALIRHLGAPGQSSGRGAGLQGRAASRAARAVLGLMLLAAIILWLRLARGQP